MENISAALFPSARRGEATCQGDTLQVKLPARGRLQVVAQGLEHPGKWEKG